MNRRIFLEQTRLLSAGLLLAPFITKATKNLNPTILVVSGWQDVNIGDIGHTPGLLHILETYIPKSTVILWKKKQWSRSEEIAE